MRGSRVLVAVHDDALAHQYCVRSQSVQGRPSAAKSTSTPSKSTAVATAAVCRSEPSNCSSIVSPAVVAATAATATASNASTSPLPTFIESIPDRLTRRI